MIVKVVMSKVTLAPTISLDLSRRLLTPTTYLGPPDDFTMSKIKGKALLMLKSLTVFLVQLFKHLSDDLTHGLAALHLGVCFGYFIALSLERDPQVLDL